MSMICTLIEMIAHFLAFVTSAKYFFKSKESYIVELQANTLQQSINYTESIYKMNQDTSIFKIENPANVDLFILKYFFVFVVKVLVAYFRFRKNFLDNRNPNNPFDLEVF